MKKAEKRTKAVTITLTPEQVEKAKKDSYDLFGRENLSGFIQVLIKRGLKDDK